MIRSLLREWGIGGPAGYVFVGRAVAMGSSILTALVASRLLGAEGRGVVVGFAAVQYLLASGLAAGTGSAVYLLASRREQTATGIAGSILTVGAGIAVLTSIAALGAIRLDLSPHLLPGLDAAVVMVIGPAAGCQYVATAMIQLAMGTSRAAATMATLALAPAGLLGATLVVTVSHGNAASMVVAYAIAWAVAALVATAIVSARPRFSGAVSKRVLEVGSPAALGDIANALSYRSDVVLLALLAGPSAVGVYSLAVQAMEPLWLLAGSAAGGLLIALPRQSPATWRASTVRATLRVGIATAIGAGAVVLLMPFLAGVAGPSFADSPGVALLLAPAIVFLAASKTLAVVQLARGRLWLATAISASSLAVNTSSNALLIPTFGAAGAAIGSVISYGASALLWIRALRR